MNKHFSCPTCGNSKLDSDHRYCEACGEDFRPHLYTFSCCGTVILPVSGGPRRFCPFCGEKVIHPAD